MKKFVLALAAVLPLVTAAVTAAVPAHALATSVQPHDRGGDNN
jgi:hypothetical protein